MVSNSKNSLKDSELSHARQTFLGVRHKTRQDNVLFGVLYSPMSYGGGWSGEGGGTSDEALSPKNVCVGD